MLRTTLFFLILASPAFAQATDAPGFADFEAGRAAAVAGDHQKALVHLEKALAAQVKALGPRTAAVGYTEHWIGYSRSGLRQFEAAMKHFERARSIALLVEGERSVTAARELWFIADCHFSLRHYAEAEALARRAHAGISARDRRGKNHANAHLLLALIGAACREQGHFDRARVAWDQVYRIRVRELGPGAPPTLEALFEMGKAEYTLGRYESAAVHGKELLEGAEKLDPPSPGWVAAALGLRGVALAKLGRREESLPYYRRALELDLEHSGPDHPRTATSENNLGGILRDMERFEEAEKHYRKSIEIYWKQADGPGADLAYPLNGLAIIRRKQGKLAEAERLCREALAIREKLLRADAKSLGVSLVNLAEILTDRKRPDEAEAACARAFGILEKAVDTAHPEFEKVVLLWRELLVAGKKAGVLVALDRRVAALKTAEWEKARRAAGLAELKGRDEAAMGLWTRAVEIAGNDRARVRLARAGRGRALLHLGRREEAVIDLEAAAKAWRDAPPSEDFPRKRNLVNLAQVLRDLKRPKETIAIWQEALTITDRLHGADSWTAAEVGFRLSLALIDAGKPAEAIPHLERILPLFVRMRGEESTEVIGALEYLVGALQALERWQESLGPARRWVALAEKKYGAEGPITQDAKTAYRKARENTVGAEESERPDDRK